MTLIRDLRSLEVDGFLQRKIVQPEQSDSKRQACIFAYFPVEGCEGCVENEHTKVF
jgi:hypothetical protein